MIKAIIFDIGQTLTYYPIPLNWSKLYRPAFETVSEKLSIAILEEEYAHIGSVLTKYNTRINPREIEVSSDVPYGMDNEYALGDLGKLIEYIDLPYTSNDIGFRKPLGTGLIRIAEEFHIDPSELVFAGDEKKDIECAHNAGTKGILINRKDEDKDFGQDHTINDLSGLLSLL